jgi:hypothetical protein
MDAKRLAEALKNHASEVYDTLTGNERIKDRAKGYTEPFKKGVLSSFPMLSKDPQNVTITDMLSSGFGVIPGTFIGPKAATWSADAAAAATKMLDDGIDPAQVWKEHLIGRMPDKSLFSEIPDNQAFYRGSEAAGSSYANDVYLHPDLYDNYKGLSNIRIKEFDGNGGSYDDTGMIASIGQNNASSTMAHELQHAIQQREGWARGGSPEGMAVEYSNARKNWDFFTDAKMLMDEALKNHGGSLDNALKEAKEAGFDDLSQEHIDAIMRMGEKGIAKKAMEAESALKELAPPFSQQYGDMGHNLYKRLTGEAQARATQDRLNMDMQQRRENYPLAGGKLSDIPLEQLIYRYSSKLLPATMLGFGMANQDKNPLAEALRNGY